MRRIKDRDIEQTLNAQHTVNLKSKNQFVLEKQETRFPTLLRYYTALKGGLP